MSTAAAAADQARDLVRTRWWWVRHAPVIGHDGRIYGQRDLDCDCGDAAAFESLAMALPANAVWVTSRLLRARRTAAALIASGAVPSDGQATPLAIEALAEQHLGDWQGLVRAEFFATRPPQPGSWWFAPAEERPPNGESFADVVERVRPVIAAMTGRFSGRDIVAVAHGGTIRAALAVALGLAPQAALAFAIEHCSLTRLDHCQGGDGAGWRVVMVNHQPRAKGGPAEAGTGPAG